MNAPNTMMPIQMGQQPQQQQQQQRPPSVPQQQRPPSVPQQHHMPYPSLALPRLNEMSSTPPPPPIMASPMQMPPRPSTAEISNVHRPAESNELQNPTPPVTPKLNHHLSSSDMMPGSQKELDTMRFTYFINDGIFLRPFKLTNDPSISFQIDISPIQSSALERREDMDLLVKAFKISNDFKCPPHLNPMQFDIMLAEENVCEWPPNMMVYFNQQPVKPASNSLPPHMMASATNTPLFLKRFHRIGHNQIHLIKTDEQCAVRIIFFHTLILFFCVCSISIFSFFCFSFTTTF